MPDWLRRLLARLRPAPAASAPAPILPGTLASAINRVRAENGLRSLLRDPGLERSARMEVADCVEAGKLAHFDFAGRIQSAHPGTPAGEDIAEGSLDADAVVALWMADPPHRANVLGDWNILGCASATAPDGTLYIAADFDKD